MAQQQNIVLVGLMGAGKSSIGRRLAARLGMPFVDADTEIEKAAGMTIEEIFSRHGEASFRDGERKVIARILEGRPVVLATGGGAFMNAETRRRIKGACLSIWLKADLDVLLKRCLRRSNRPLLKQGDPRDVLTRLMQEREPVYAEADMTVKSGDGPHESVVEEIIARLRARGAAEPLPGLDQARPADQTVEVDLGERQYEIRVGQGLLSRLGASVADLLSRPLVPIVTDETVARLHLHTVEESLRAQGIEPAAIVLPAGEATKSFTQLERLLDELADRKVERRDLILALGGGVIGDLVGFAAALLRRGVPFVQVPTTLLAQVDSSVGGKTAINSRHGKNLIGVFNQPRRVLADISALDTLPRRELLAGYAEVAKYGLLGDAGFFAWLEEHGAALLDGDPALRTEAVVHSCRMKAGIVARDEREEGERALLNLGHTFGHALEAETGFGERLLHGEAVAIGCVLAFALSARLGHCPPAEAHRVRAHFAAIGLPVSPAPYTNDARRLIEHMRQDKKVVGGRMTFILARGIGQGFITRDIADADVQAVLEGELERAA